MLLCLVTVASTASACSSPPKQPSPPTSSAPSLIVPSGPNDVDTDVPAPEAEPTWDESARAEAVQSATAAMTAFVDHDADATAWWKKLSPLLSTQAAADYTGTDPDQVPAQAVTGPAVLVDDTSVYLARVEVPTDVGAYQVLLSRSGDGQPWLVERLSPPPEQGPG